MVKAVAGRPLALECVARGHPPPTLSWYHKGLPVVESNETWLEAGGSTLGLESPGEAAGGLYSCVASSAAGEAVLQYVVEVQGEPGLSRPGHLGCGAPGPRSPRRDGSGGEVTGAPVLHETDQDTGPWAEGPAELAGGSVEPGDQGPCSCLGPWARSPRTKGTALPSRRCPRSAGWKLWRTSRGPKLGGGH